MSHSKGLDLNTFRRSVQRAARASTSLPATVVGKGPGMVTVQLSGSGRLLKNIPLVGLEPALQETVVVQYVAVDQPVAYSTAYTIPESTAIVPAASSSVKTEITVEPTFFTGHARYRHVISNAFPKLDGDDWVDWGSSSDGANMDPEGMINGSQVNLLEGIYEVIFEVWIGGGSCDGNPALSTSIIERMGTGEVTTTNRGHALDNYDEEAWFSTITHTTQVKSTISNEVRIHYEVAGVATWSGEAGLFVKRLGGV